MLPLIAAFAVSLYGVTKASYIASISCFSSSVILKSAGIKLEGSLSMLLKIYLMYASNKSIILSESKLRVYLFPSCTIPISIPKSISSTNFIISSISEALISTFCSFVIFTKSSAISISFWLDSFTKARKASLLIYKSAPLVYILI